MAGTASNFAGAGAQSGLTTGLDALQPKVAAAFEGEDVASLSRPELALRIGQVVTIELDETGTTMPLTERRKLVSALIEWIQLIGASGGISKAKPESAPLEREEKSAPSSTPKLTVEKVKTEKKAAQGPTVTAAKKKIHPLVMERLDVSAASQLPRDDLARQVSDIVTEVAREEKLQLNFREQQQIVDLMLDDMLGLGPLEPLLADEAITDIMVNGPNQVYVEKKGKLTLTDVTFQNGDHLINIARRIVSAIGRRVDESHPLVDARLLDGSRVNIVIPPLAIDGASISIRKFAKKGITLDLMAKQGNISPEMATVLKIAARSQLNILISGGTGSGKTTLLNAMSQLIDTGERIVTIEDAAELQLQQPHVVRLETRPPNLEGTGEITMRDLVKNALRMRPDRIILSVRFVAPKRSTCCRP
jgi:pilus assembly protein CpaF